MLAQRNQWPPYGLARAGFHLIQGTPESAEDIRPPVPMTRPDSLITIRSRAQADATRQRLRRLLWGDSARSATPVAEEKAIFDDRFAYSGLATIDRLTVEMDFGLRSVIYRFHPKDLNGHTVIYHQGHGGHFAKGGALIERLVTLGYEVIALSMPLLGPNNQPLIDSPRFGQFRLEAHDQMGFLEPPAGHPLRYFVEPVLGVMDFLGAERVAMIGLSGGAWTTTICAAIDSRIGLSFPAAGTAPMYLRFAGTLESADWEQLTPEPYRIANYLELYVLGSLGAGHGQLQILNRFDPCCFAGDAWQTYRAVVRRAVEEIGDGEFDVISDTSHRQHQISPWAADRIVETLQSRWR